MKRMILAAVIALALTLGAAAGQEKACAAEYKMAYVDLVKVFDEYGKTKESEQALGEKGKAKESERKNLVDEIRKLKDEQALLSEKAKTEKQAVIDEKIKALQSFDMKTRDELVKERNEKLGGILKDIEKVVNDLAKEQGYDMVLNSRTLLFGKENLDLTKEVLKRLNKK
jgi:outer membrane protein